MICNYSLKAVLASCLILMSTQAKAFGDRGHEIIAALAYPQLTEKTKLLIDQLLLDDQDQLTEKDFISRSTWADQYRDSDRNTTEIRYQATRAWHFVDLDLDYPSFREVCLSHKNPAKERLASQSDSDACIVDKLEEFFAELKNPVLPKTEKILALKFLLHLVGDIHQPLHAANHADRGGNQLSVRFQNQTTHRLNTTNLHSYWDRQVIEDLGENRQAVVNQLYSEISQSDRKFWGRGDFRLWALESNRVAKDVVYDFKGLKQFKDKDSQDAYVLSEKYQNQATHVAALQLKKASVRLAKLLNTAFDHSAAID